MIHGSFGGLESCANLTKPATSMISDENWKRKGLENLILFMQGMLQVRILPLVTRTDVAQAVEQPIRMDCKV